MDRSGHGRDSDWDGGGTNVIDREFVSREYHGFENPCGSRVRVERVRVRVASSLPATKPAPAGRLHGFTIE